jgi:hypothetical protein
MDHRELLRQSIDSIAKARAIENEHERAAALAALIGTVPHELKAELLDVVHAMTDDDAKAEALTQLVQHLPDELTPKALEEALGISKPSACARAISSIAGHLPPQFQNQAVDAVRKTLSDPTVRVSALALLSNSLPEERRTKVLLDALKTAGKIKVAHEKAEALSAVANQLKGEPRLDVLEKALAAARSIDDELLKAQTLTNMVRLLSPDKATDLLGEALASMANVNDESMRAIGLVRLVSELPDDQTDLIPKAWSAARSLIDDDARLEAMTEIQRILNGRGIDVDEIATKAEQDALRHPEPTQPSSSTPLATRLHSDLWTVEDQFGYSIYAKSISEFIRHPATTPPLTIGVLGPWGCGKTTLMRLTRDHLQRGRQTTASGRNPNATREASKAPKSKLLDLRKWLKRPLDFSPTKLQHPTVWFSPWKYESSDEVWAGMADSIASDLVKQLPDPIDRERFWFSLQAQRLDLTAIRQDIMAAIFDKLIPRAILALAGIFMVCFAGIIYRFAGEALAKAAFMVGGGGCAVLLLALGQGIKTYSDALAKPLEGKLSRYVSRPDYPNKSGFLTQVEEDVRRIFDLLVDPNKPAVVFIDDLDRCSPGKVAEVIQAVNLFLSGDFPNCYFVIGMDPKVVAASMEAAHKELAAQLGITDWGRSLGWQFMEKFIQLPFSIPTLDNHDRKQYLLDLLCAPHSNGHRRNATSEVPIDIKTLRNLGEALRKADSAGEVLELVESEVKRIREAATGKLPDLVQQQMMETAHLAIEVASQLFTDNDPEMESQLTRFSSYLTSPRSIKRFANLYRFYRHSHWSRAIRGLETASGAALARWVLLMLRWPQLIWWIQSSEETGLVSANTPAAKADQLERMIRQARNYDTWTKSLKGKKAENHHWCIDRDLFDFIREPNGKDERLGRAVELALW